MMWWLSVRHLRAEMSPVTTGFCGVLELVGFEPGRFRRRTEFELSWLRDWGRKCGCSVIIISVYLLLVRSRCCCSA